MNAITSSLITVSKIGEALGENKASLPEQINFTCSGSEKS